MRYRYNYKYKPRQTPQVKRVLRFSRKTGSRASKFNFAVAAKTGGSALAVFAVCVLLFFAARWTKKNFIEAEQFKIRKITASGFVNVSEKEFLERLPVSYGDNVILSYAVGIGRRMKKECPGIKSIRVERKVTGEINMVITERHPIAWRRSETGALEGVDSENVCFGLKPGECLIPELAVEQGNEKARAKAVGLLNALIDRKEKLYSDIAKLYNVGDEFFMVLKDSSKVYWSRYDGEDVGPKLSLLYGVLEDSKGRYPGFEYIDLQLAGEGRVVMMPKTAPKGKTGGKNNGKT